MECKFNDDGLKGIRGPVSQERKKIETYFWAQPFFQNSNKRFSYISFFSVSRKMLFRNLHLDAHTHAQAHSTKNKNSSSGCDIASDCPDANFTNKNPINGGYLLRLANLRGREFESNHYWFFSQ